MSLYKGKKTFDIIHLRLVIISSFLKLRGGICVLFFHSRASEIYLKPVKDYVEINTDLTFYEVTKSANVKEEIAIGYKLNNAAHISEIKINPDKNSIINFGENDMIIVISED